MIRTDIHSHLLPGIDDGAQNVAETSKLISELKRQGVGRICLTPHFYSHVTQLDRFVSNRNESFEAVKNLFQEANIDTKVGAEVYLTRVIFGYEDVSKLCYENTQYMLTELPSGMSTFGELGDSLNKLFANFSVVPIIAHVERYKWLFNKEGLIWLNNAGCLIQIDNEALENKRNCKRIKSYIDNELIHLCGSDSHDSIRRRPNFDLIDEKLDKDQISYLNANAEEIFK